MKKFNVNRHNFFTVECDIPLRYCPVYYKILLNKATKGELTWSQNCDYNPNIVLNIKTLGSAKGLKAEIINLCVNCNFQGR